jgi:hypothetical protein
MPRGVTAGVDTWGNAPLSPLQTEGSSASRTQTFVMYPRECGSSDQGHANPACGHVVFLLSYGPSMFSRDVLRRVQHERFVLQFQT